MESTAAVPALPAASQSRAAAVAEVPDPRRAAILALALSAILANHRSVLAIAEWGKRQSGDLLTTLGFPDGRTPASRRCSACFASSMAMRWRSH